MASIPGVRFDITGASGSQGLLSPKDSWRAYVFPRGGYASQASTGTQITFDSAAIASRFVTNNWIQSGLPTANIRQVTGVGGNSITLNTSLTVAINDRIFLIGNTQPTVVGGSATYTTPNTLIRQRDDDSATLYTNSMVTTDSNGGVQWFAQAGVYDVLVQDGNGANQGAIYDLPVGVSTDYAVTFGVTVTVGGALGVTGTITGTTINVTTVRSRRRPVYDVTHPDWGALGDGVTDDSTAINAAITAANAAGGGVVLFPRGNYKCNITLRQGVVLLGMGGRDVNAGNGATLNAFNPNTAVITFQNTHSWMEIRNLTVWAGNSHCIARFTGTGAQTNLLVDNCTLQPGSGAAGIYLEGDLEELYFSNLRVQTGAYGIYFANVAEAGGSNINALARCTFRDLFLTGQTKTGLRINCGTRANAIGFYNVTITNSQESAVLLSRMDDTTFVNLNIEGAAQGSTAARWTTGSITSGSSALTIGSSAGYVVGDTATVQGAGTNGVDLVSVITNIAGATITLTNNASTTVTNADVTRSVIDMIALDTAPGGTMGYNMTFIGCGLDDANSPVRYTMNLSNTGGNCTFIDCNVGGDATNGKAPIYDPLGYATIIGGTILYRQAGVANDQFRNSTFSNANIPGGNRGRGSRTQIMSAQGGALVMGLRDSNDDGTGTYGAFELRNRDASRTLLMSLDGAGTFTLSGTSNSNIVQAASLTLPGGHFFGVSGTLGAGTSIGSIVGTTGRHVFLWAAAGTMGFSNSDTLRVIGNSFNVPVNGAVQAFSTGTTWFIFSPSS